MKIESGPSDNKEVAQTPVSDSPNKTKYSEAASGSQQSIMAVEPNPKVDGFVSKFFLSSDDMDHRFETRICCQETSTPRVSQHLNMAAEQPNPKVDGFISKFIRNRDTQPNSNYAQDPKIGLATSEVICIVIISKNVQLIHF